MAAAEKEAPAAKAARGEEMQSDLNGALAALNVHLRLWVEVSHDMTTATPADYGLQLRMGPPSSGRCFLVSTRLDAPLRAGHVALAVPFFTMVDPARALLPLYHLAAN